MLEKSVMQTCLLPSMLTKSMFIQQVFVMNSCSVQCLLRSKERGTDLVTISTFYASEERSSFFTSVFCVRPIAYSCAFKRVFSRLRACQARNGCLAHTRSSDSC